MNKSIVPSKVLILLVAACLVWIGILSLAYVVVSRTTVSAGWIVAGALVCAVVAWVLVMIREIRDAIELPDFFAQGNRGDEGYDEMGASTEARPSLGLAGRVGDGRRAMRPFRGGGKSRPRKVRSSWVAVSGSSNR